MHSPGPVSREALQDMIALLRHRGPDEAGIYLDDRVGLGHARLSIIDLSSGIQPIHNEDETLWIVYNGETYNYPELKEELLRKGHRFYTTSDTEVLLHLYEEKGAACVEDLNGQFAFAIWNSRKKELFLARDRIGIRPLHYTVKNDLFIFSSEIKSIFACGEIDRNIDPLAMDQIFTFWTTLPGRTAFKNICELQPGHYLTLSGGQVTIKRYWDIPFCPRREQLNMAPDEISGRIRELLLDAVRIRLRSDVPVGTYLSGGLDSSGLTALVAKNFDKDVKTFGIRFKETAFDEGTYQNQMVSFLKTDQTEILATNEKIGTSFPEVIGHTEKPLLRTAPVPLYLLSRAVRDSGLKVILTGEGADEIFGGYNIFREAKVRRFWAKEPDSNCRGELIGRLYPYIFNDARLKRSLQSFFAKGLTQTNDPLFSHMIRWENTSKIKRFFSQDLKASIGAYSGYDEVKQRLPGSFDKWDYLCQAQYLETEIFLSNYLLSSQGDRVAMAHSVEIRLPYLDPRLMEFMGRVPAKYKIFGLNEKYILKKAFDGILPKDIVKRAKHPYRAPITKSLLKGRAAEYTLEMLSERAAKNAGLFDTKKVTNLLRKLKTADAASEVDSMTLVGILSSQILYHQFIDDLSVENGRNDSFQLIVNRVTQA